MSLPKPLPRSPGGDARFVSISRRCPRRCRSAPRRRFPIIRFRRSWSATATSGPSPRRAPGALLLDDVHSLAGQERMQEHLMDGLVAWAKEGRILALTSDRAPGDVAGLAARVRDEFVSGVIAGIAPPEPSLCLRLVHSK